MPGRPLPGIDHVAPTAGAINARFRWIGPIELMAADWTDHF